MLCPEVTNVFDREPLNDSVYKYIKMEFMSSLLSSVMPEWPDKLKGFGHR